MLWIYTAMLETAEQKDKITFIYENYAGLMYHVAISVVGEHYLAEDAVHETFLWLIRIIDEVEINDSKKLKRFLTVLTHSKSVDIVRKLNKVKPTSDDELMTHFVAENEPEDIALSAIVFEKLIAYVKQLDDKYKAPLSLRLMGYSIHEIANILEITPQNAKVRLHRARQMILKEVEAQDDSAGKL